MKVFWISAFLGCTTGYGVVSKEILYRLADMGFEVYNIADFSPQGIPWGLNLTVSTEKGNEIKILPSTQQGSTVVEYFVKRYNPDLLVVFWDPFRHLSYLREIKKPKIWYTPIDGPVTSKTAEILDAADYIVAYSKFGYNELQKVFPMSRLFYIPHGVNTKIFRPMNKKKCRRKLGLPEDKIIFLTIFANLGVRKQIPQLLDAFSRFARYRDDVILYLHTNEADYPYGFDYRFLIKEMKLEDKVIISERNTLIDPVEEEEIAMLINAADWYVCSSEAEGFGCPLIQSIACGTPLIAVANSSQTELALGCGLLVQPSFDYVSYPLYVPYHTKYRPPSIYKLEECLKVAADMDSSTYNTLRKNCIAKARKYDWNAVFKRWPKILNLVLEDFRLMNTIIKNK